MSEIRLGIDLGGTKIEIAAIGRNKETLMRHRIDSPRNNYTATIEAMAQLVEQAESELSAQCTVGIATPGAISPATGLIKNSNSVWLNSRPLKEDVENRLSRPVRLSNDANCFVLSEWVDGAAQGTDSAFGVIVGTGTGGGFVINSQLISGANAIAGEWGHNPLPWPQSDELPGPECYCGNRGCIETFLSGPGLSAYYETLSGEAVDVEEITSRSAAGESLAETCLNKYDDRMARALASVINIIDLDVIVLGGGLSKLERLYINVSKLWLPYIFSDHVTTRLVPPEHGDSSGVRGAAWLWE